MTTVRIYFDGERAGPLFRRAWENQSQKIRDSIRSAAKAAGDEAVEKGKASMQAGGNFGKWAEGLSAEITEGGGNIAINVKIDQAVAPFFWVFQDGMVIHGKPLLWIPLSFADVPKGMWARDFPGGLFRVDRKSGGAPLLFSITDKQPKYFGKEQVTEPKKYSVVEAAQEAASKLVDFYKSARAEQG